MAMTPREPSEDEDRPPPPKESIGRLPKGERPASLPRGKGELLKYVAAYGDWENGRHVSRWVHLGVRIVTPPIMLYQRAQKW